MLRLPPALLGLLLAGCAGAPALETRWPAHPDDAALIEARIDLRLAESLEALAALGPLLSAEGVPPEAVRAAAETAAAKAAAFRALASARAAATGGGPGAAQTLLLVSAATACHENARRIAGRIGADGPGPAPAALLARARIACLSGQTLRLAAAG